jgi:hypothetical protein
MILRRRRAARAQAGAGAGRLGRVFVAGAFIRVRHSEESIGPQLMAMHHHVDHAVILQIFGALKPARQFLPDGLFDHARPGETDQGARLRDMHVAEHGVGRGHAAGRRVGQHDDVRLAGLAQHLDRDRGARKLHQRENALLHARAAGGREHDEGRAALGPRFRARG